MKTRLSSETKPTVDVEYNLIRQFARGQRYKIRAVNGMIFNVDGRDVRGVDWYGAKVLDSNSVSAADCRR